MVGELRSRRPWHPILLALFALALLVSGCTFGGDQGKPSPIPVGTPGRDGVLPGQLEAFASVTIGEAVERRLGRLEVIPAHAILPSGETTVFSVIPYDNHGNALGPEEVETRWRMLDRHAGTISRSGVFRAALQRGVFSQAIEVSVSQEVGGRLVELQSLASVSVIRPLSEQDISRVQMLPSELRVERGTQVFLTALPLDRDGIPVPGVRLSWEMLNAAAGRVDAEGRFTSGTRLGAFPGAVRVVARKREDPTQSASTTLSITVVEAVVAGQPTRVNLYPQAISLRSGDTIQFRALALDQTGNLFRNVQTSWALRDSKGGELDGLGKFRAGPTPGTYTNLVQVTVTPSGGGEPVSLRAMATVTVLEPVRNPRRLERLLLTPEVVRLRQGESIKLVAKALTRIGLPIPSATLRWSAQEGVAQVTPNGVVTALGSPGIYPDAVTVQVTEMDGDREITRTAKARVIILGPLARVEIVPRQVTASPKQVIQFTYLAYDTNGVRLFDVLGSWKMMDRGAGTIDVGGLFVAGTKQGEYKDAIRVIVKPPKLKTGGQ